MLTTLTPLSSFGEVSGSIRTEKLREPLENILVFDEPENRQCDDKAGDEDGGDVDVGDNVLTLDHADHHLDMRPETLEQDLLLQVILVHFASCKGHLGNVTETIMNYC